MAKRKIEGWVAHLLWNRVHVLCVVKADNRQEAFKKLKRMAGKSSALHLPEAVEPVTLLPGHGLAVAVDRVECLWEKGGGDE